MKLSLWHRHYGQHTFIKKVAINYPFARIYKGNDKIDEGKLLMRIPPGFLSEGGRRIEPRDCLIMVQKKKNDPFTHGQSKLKVFRNWAKYFDSYSIEISR